ncbi:MAG: hypothetical protein ACOYN6_09535 [Ignavibacteria bacterium]
MARIVKSFLGTPSGKHGDIVYKRVNKNTFSYKASQAYKETNSDAVFKNRDVFKSATKFSIFLNRSDLLKKIWKRSKVQGKSTRMQIFKFNHVNIKLYGINSGCHIVPDNIHLRNPGVALNEDSLTIKFTAYDNRTGFDLKYEKFSPPFVFVAVIYMKDPVKAEAEHKEVYAILEETLVSEELSRDKEIHFTFDTDEKSFNVINDYNTVIVFPAVVSIDNYNLPLKWAECGGIYIKGKHPEVILAKKQLPLETPGKKFKIEYK